MNARPEKKQLIIIAIILVLGAVGGALILRGGESHGESDGHGHEEESSQVEGGASKAGAKETGSGTSAEQSKSPSGASEEAHKEDEEKVALTDEQVKAAGIVIKESGAAVIRTTLQLPGEIRFNEDRTAHIVPRAAGVFLLCGVQAAR